MISTIGAQHDVAGQQRADRRVGRDRLVGERRVARAEDEVGRHLDTELGVQRGGHVDLGQHAEALGLERIGRRLAGSSDVAADADPERVAILEHAGLRWVGGPSSPVIARLRKCASLADGPCGDFRLKC
jgi:hypothetical protein